MNKHDAKTPPEQGRLISCKGHGRTGEFECCGRFAGRVFWFRMPDGSFVPARDTWNAVSEWEYVDEK